MGAANCFLPAMLSLVVTIALSAQDVGVATSSPDAPFHVHSSGQVLTPGGLVLLGDRSEGHMIVDFNLIDTRFGAVGTLPLSLNAGGGRVGVNTSSPQSAFHVYNPGAVNTPGGMVILGNPDEGHLELDFNIIQSSFGAINQLELSLQPDGGDLDVGNGVLFVDRGNSRAGINNTNPQFDLDVTGDVRVSNNLETDNLTVHQDGSVEGDLFVSQYITHSGDLNTQVEFTNDRMRFYSGGVLMLDLQESGSDVARLGATGIDVEICDDNLFVSGNSTHQVGIGTQSPNAALHIAMANSLSSGLLLENSTSQQDWRFLVNGNADIDLFWQDNLRGRFDDATGNYTPMSDARFKKDVCDLDHGLKTLRQLHPVSYVLTEDPAQTRHVGFLAQEVEDVIQHAVLYDATSDRYTLSYTEISVVAVKSIQELADKVDQLEHVNQRLLQENAMLRGRLSKLEAFVAINQ